MSGARSSNVWAVAVVFVVVVLAALSMSMDGEHARGVAILLAAATVFSGWLVFNGQRRRRRAAEYERSALLNNQWADKASDEEAQFAGVVTIDDYLGRAAEAHTKARIAWRDKHYDEAWGNLITQKQLYLQHAIREKFSAHELLALDASVDVHMANVLRMEGRHRQAFLHIMYAMMAGRTSFDIGAAERVAVYYRRAKLTKTSLSDVLDYARAHCGRVEFTEIREQTAWWFSKEE
ncbi:hypothetical protein [Chitinolyticbacter meiyuanensis]|uniref:hypothetical protein n=1 Tax=Chitinolyticbacter meiyuanensis TaxID=682798 RepID=UPI0011E5D49A|nr:hypothetical protein [Chitinolyticbacter meiyuanensis]